MVLVSPGPVATTLSVAFAVPLMRLSAAVRLSLTLSVPALAAVARPFATTLPLAVRVSVTSARADAGTFTVKPLVSAEALIDLASLTLPAAGVVAPGFGGGAPAAAGSRTAPPPG